MKTLPTTEAEKVVGEINTAIDTLIDQAVTTLLTTDGKGKEEKTIALNLLLGLAFRQNVNLKNRWYK